MVYLPPEIMRLIMSFVIPRDKRPHPHPNAKMITKAQWLFYHPKLKTYLENEAFYKRILGYFSIIKFFNSLPDAPPPQLL